MRVLFLAANPSGTAPLQLGREVRTIEERLRAADLRDTFTLISHWAVRPADLSDYLLRHTPHIVHFSGHGTAQGAIVLEDSNGVAAAVSPQALGQLFHALRDNVRCVVLNACFSATQAQAIVNEIDCVVGMAQPIGDNVAIEFASGFYRTLGYGRSVQTAFDVGCSEIALAGFTHVALPQLLVKVGVDPSTVVMVEEGHAIRPSQPALDRSSRSTQLQSAYGVLLAGLSELGDADLLAKAQELYAALRQEKPNLTHLYKIRTYFRGYGGKASEIATLFFNEPVVLQIILEATQRD